MAKRYYWLKLKEDFFDDDTISFIEEQNNGVYYVNFYLKLCLKSLKADGKLVRLVGDRFIPYDAAGLAKLTNTPIDTVRAAMQLFSSIGLVKVLETGELYLSQMNELIGSETDKAMIMRRKRAEQKALGTMDTPEVLESGNNVTQMLPHIEKEEEIELETEGEIEPARFCVPSIDEVSEYCEARGNSIDPQRFIDYYSSNGWKVGRNDMADWKAAIRSWEHLDDNKAAKEKPPIDMNDEYMQAFASVGAL